MNERSQSTNFGIEKRVFIDFTELTGAWAARLYRYIKSIDRSQEFEDKKEGINFLSFINLIRLQCRSTENTMDESLF